MRKIIDDTLVPYIKSRHSILWIPTPEETRADSMARSAREMCSDPKNGTNFNLIRWSLTKGLAVEFGLEQKYDAEKTKLPRNALDEIYNFNHHAIFLFHDLHPHLNDPYIRRQLRDISTAFRSGLLKDKVANKEIPLYRTLIIISPESNIPADLKHDITVVDFKLPNEHTLEVLVRNLLSSERLIDLVGGEEEIPALIDACKGLTTVEAGDCISKCIVAKKMDPQLPSIVQMVMEEKARTIKKTGILEFYPTTIGIEDVGGLEALKRWLRVRKAAFSKRAKDFGLPPPRGILLAGIPGCGKSLIAKAIASSYKLPLIKFEVSRIFGGLVGQSETNMRVAIETAEAIGKCVLWIDEIDKGFAGMKSSSSGDSGVSQRVFGNFITWMQEKQEKDVTVFMVATANRISGLPPELMRKGRFDQLVFVNLPTKTERKDIFRIHIAKKRKDLKLNLDLLAEKSAGLSGSEIGEVVISALYEAFDLEAELSEELILKEIEKTHPLSRSHAEDMEELIKWAKDNAMQASDPEEDSTVRNISVGDRRLE